MQLEIREDGLLLLLLLFLLLLFAANVYNVLLCIITLCNSSTYTKQFSSSTGLRVNARYHQSSSSKLYGGYYALATFEAASKFFYRCGVFAIFVVVVVVVLVVLVVLQKISANFQDVFARLYPFVFGDAQRFLAIRNSFRGDFTEPRGSFARPRRFGDVGECHGFVRIV